MTSFFSKQSKRKDFIRRFLIAGFISFLIGFVFMFLACPGCPMKITAILQNGGYSLFLGYGLFAFGFVFSWLEKRYVAWITKPVLSLLLVLLFSTFYSSIVIVGVNYIWHTLIGKMDFSLFVSNYGYIMWIEFIIFYFIALWFYARSFFFEWRQEVENREKLKREALQLQYESLKTQVNPHFLFNSLNALNMLIDVDVQSARTFTTELSRFYRDILQLKGRELISIDEELTILKRYLYLQKIRFGDKFKFILDTDQFQKGLVIPLSVQMLIENVFKHNVISSDQQLEIKVQARDGILKVSNTYLPKEQKEPSTGLGLNNLKERITYLTGKQVEYGITGNEFTVVLPLIFVDNESSIG